MRSHFLNPLSRVLGTTCRAISVTFNSLASACDGSVREHTESIPLDHGFVEELSFREVIEWITTNGPQNVKSVRAVLLKEQHDQFLKVVTAFLDSENNLIMDSRGVPCGRAQRVRKIDLELSDYFGAQSMIVIE
ncbi:hypothetical protein [Gimesia maris]|uniref:Uncharacterized protein n=1 Tax=Gimesia maris TaxID=122 RepID=A0ABX5YR44_9PLAN|nr:hypothetical protein [Gimesia maris]EDL59251.1 hypothetical protein PM8797T_23429 [Gimesia maris DSM 8797]QEG18211.1 hypothetical protein GmarT_40970 [Gimesia maris]QGQ28788.1 hypothetical protein F1729_09105 [Gimesia maris]